MTEEGAILQLCLFTVCISDLEEVCRKGLKQNCFWDGTKCLPPTHRRRSGQMAVRTKQVNNQIGNKLSRLCKHVWYLQFWFSYCDRDLIILWSMQKNGKKKKSWACPKCNGGSMPAVVWEGFWEEQKGQSLWGWENLRKNKRKQKPLVQCYKSHLQVYLDCFGVCSMRWY